MLIDPKSTLRTTDYKIRTGRPTDEKGIAALELGQYTNYKVTTAKSCATSKYGTN